MGSAYDLLGITPRLVLADEALREAFREAGRKAHPDGGGAEGEFTALAEALAVLSSPARRLREWMTVRGWGLETRGAIDGELMDLFASVGSTSQRVEGLLRRREGAKSALVRAMLEGETQRCREEVEAALRSVEERMAEECRVFEVLEVGGGDEALASRVYRNLVFLEKWRHSLRGFYGRLV